MRPALLGTVSPPGDETAPACGPGPLHPALGPSTAEREAANALASLFRPAIRRVTLMLTTRCNLACRYCYQVRDRPRTMPEAVAHAALDRLFASPAAETSVGLYGGEPLLEPSLVRRVVERVRREAPAGRATRVRLFTNGLLLDPEIAAFLAHHGVHVAISLDGLPPAQDDRGRNTFRSVDATLRRHRRVHADHFRTQVEVRMTLTSRNVGTLAASVLHLLHRGVEEIALSPLTTPDQGWGDASARELDRQLGLLAEATIPADAARLASVYRPFRAAGAAGDSSPPCGFAARHSRFVDVDGSIAPCAFLASSTLCAATPLVREVARSLPALHVADAGLDDALAVREGAARALPFLRPHAARRSPRGPCASCEALSECFVCPASIAFAPEQDPDLVPSIQCDWNRLVAKHRRAFLARLASREADLQGAGRSSSAAATSAVTPVRIAGA